ncbi:CPBP family glutamic-type intramembrane protease [Burkholderia contaminans]|uniref:CPBP family glutamic-type intramembrane protease n=1 Tax=Burkholderia contaminans TaxID=488447 RepID=UPI002416F1E0|nr:CPBP family glutamic-type intramembrane protease [Burkholderia contaminans]WFN15389.1 CPBP family glutamic-type intramembrane protease [Burkholderia contaminans]
MKTESHSFIDLAELGRTDWWAPVLTVLLLAVIGSFFSFVAGITLGGSLYLKTVRIATIGVDILSGATNKVFAIFGFWLACQYILRRPFRSLISADLTFRIRRCLFGAALYLPAHIVSLMVLTIYLSMRSGSLVIPFRHFEPPDSTHFSLWMLGLFSIPLLAFSEELFFRGWLTQTLKQYMRPPIFVVAIVAVVFAIYHAQYNLHQKMEIFASSLGFSVLSLQDQRLELSIGAHVMTNICVTLQNLLFSGYLPSMHFTPMPFDWFALAAIKGALPFALMYWFLQKTSGWSAPNGKTEVSDVQPA